MKRLIIFLGIIALASVLGVNGLVSTAAAQAHKSAEARAGKRAGKLATALSLTEAQQQQVQGFVQEFIQKRDAIKEQGAKNHEAMRPLRQELDTKITGVLTPEQKTKYLALKEELHQKHQEKHGGKGGHQGKHQAAGAPDHNKGAAAHSPEYDKAVEDLILN